MNQCQIWCDSMRSSESSQKQNVAAKYSVKFDHKLTYYSNLTSNLFICIFRNTVSNYIHEVRCARGKTIFFFFISYD